MNKFISFCIGCMVVLLTWLMISGCNNTHSSKTLSMALVVGIQNSPSNALVIIADDKNLFDTTKVKVQIKEFSAGKLALQALLGAAGDLDMAVSAETPVVLSSLGGNQVNVISQVVNASNECRIVVRRDGNLNTPETYFSKKRIITTSQGGSPEWLTYNFLKKYNLTQREVEINAMAPENMPIALANKAVDGVSIFDPYARLAEKELGDAALTFLNEDMKSYYILSVKGKTLTEKKEAIIAFIDGLKKAESFVKKNTSEAQQIIARRTKLDIDIIKTTWSNYEFRVGIDEALIKTCQQEAHWAIETGKYPKSTPIPDFSKILTSEYV
ncbi:MAG: ABC transporter substrate-binding protein, partial [Saprospiraceae bacterium]